MKGWYGVDLDGTLAEYDSWKGPEHIGAPIIPMVWIVQYHISRGDTVKIFTARVASGNPDRETARHAIAKWTKIIFGRELEATAEKDMGLIAYYDDRAVQVVPNMGKVVDFTRTPLYEAMKGERSHGKSIMGDFSRFNEYIESLR